MLISVFSRAFVSPFPHNSTEFGGRLGWEMGRGVYCSSETVFVEVYKAQESILPAYVAWQAGTTNGVVVPARQAEKRFLGSLKGRQMGALYYMTLGI